MKATAFEFRPPARRHDDGAIPRGVFRTFLAVNRRLASESKLERAMEYLLEAAMTLSGARTGLLQVVRQDGVRLEVRAGDTPPQGLTFSRSLVHRAIQTRRPITAEEPQADRGLMEMPAVRGLAVESVLCVPFVSASGTEGALYVEHAGRPGVFGDREKEHLEVLADQAAIAVDRLVREEQLAAELERSRRSLEVVSRTTAAGGAWPAISVREAEERTIRAGLLATGGDKTAAAKLLGISRTALYDKLKRMDRKSREPSPDGALL